MTEYYVAALRATRAEDLYIGFFRPAPGDGVCWPLPWAGAWTEAEVAQAAAELNDGVGTVAVPRAAVQALATMPPPGKIDGDVGPVVRNSASNRRALIVAGRRDTARSETFEIPRAADAVQGNDRVVKALGVLVPLLGREESIEDDRLWQLRAELLALLRSDDRRRVERAVQAANEAAGRASATFSEIVRPQRPVRTLEVPVSAEAAVLRSPPASEPPPAPPPDTQVGAKPIR